PGIECASLRLAEKAGLRVPALEIRHIGDRKVMLIQRFDRYWFAPTGIPALNVDLLLTQPGGGAVEHRLAFVSGLTMVACDESESITKAYTDLARAVRAHCHPSVVQADNEELFKRMVYNVLVSNDDDHLRNHGFLFDPRIRGWRLSPLYDVLPRASHATERFLHLGVGPQGRLATLDNALAAHAMFTLSKAKAAQLIADVWKTVREWKVFFEGFGVSADEIANIAPAFRRMDDVSTPEIRKLLP
ncbi:MAG: HipA domain-containing protein, partial [Burkholderiaceae bacterium]|nr:HipA domain-containing protein [Burkholderiaceae bacterium]